MRLLFRIFQISPIIAINKIIDKIRSKIQNKFQFRRDSQSLTYERRPDWLKSLPFHTFALPEIDFLNHYKESIYTSAALICSHHFDLLGTGIVNVRHGLEAEGMVGHKYENSSKIKNKYDFAEHIRHTENREFIKRKLNLLPDDYHLIDWQVDFQCGYRWSENTWSKHIKYGNALGADIKVPWELGRMQFLLPLSLGYMLATKEKQTAKAQRYANEFMNLVVDFYISNPPKFGTQWMCAMDVSIRAVNLCCAYSFFLQAGYQFSKDFNDLLLDMINDHYIFIEKNLEWSSGLRGNHYLAGVSALIIISSYLPSNETTDSIMAIAADKLITEIFAQFYKDGGNFENSMSYHRFSFEMVATGLFALLSLPAGMRYNVFKMMKTNHINLHSENFITVSKELTKRLFKIFEFQLFATTKSQYLPQFGDNDSGYFLRFSPFYLKNILGKVVKKDYFFYNSNNSWNILSFFCGYFFDLFDNRMLERYLEYYSARQMRIRSKVDFDYSDIKSIIIESNNYLESKADSTYYRAKEFRDFGLYSIWRNKYHFIFFAGGIGQRGKGGHDHNNRLSFELLIDEIPIIVNTGTYCYTPLPSERNLYRSVHMHNTLVFSGLEQNTWHSEKADDLFWLDGDRAKAKMLKFTDKGLIAEHRAYGEKHIRKITFESNEISFIDECQKTGYRRILLHFVPGVDIIIEDDHILCEYKHIFIKIPKTNFDYSVEVYNYSSHYGLLQHSKRLVIGSNEKVMSWKILI